MQFWRWLSAKALLRRLSRRWGRAIAGAMATAPPRRTRILELRIHGLKNTPPGAMLGVEESAVVRSRGDDLGGFWTEHTPTAPAGVLREAYSWGAMARTGGSTFAGIGQLFVHIGWLLLMPFGLTNLAYWSRRIPAQDASPGWRAGIGAASIRLFALGLTLLFVTAIATVSIDLVGLQCYRQPQGLCAAVPGLLDAVAGDNRALRLAVLSLFPLLVVLGLYLVSQRARVRYEESMQDEVADAPDETRTAPLLATRGFWSESRIGAPSERLHFAAAFLLIAALLGWNQLFGAATECVDPLRFFGSGCLTPDGPVGAAPAVAIVLAATLALLVTVAALVGIRTNRALAGAVLIAAGVAFVATVVVTSLSDTGAPGMTRGLLGLVATPVALLATMGALSLAALGWRRGVPVWLSITLVVASLAIPLGRLVSEPLWSWGAEHPEIWFVATGAVVAAQLLCARFWPVRRGTHVWEAWSGAAPGVLMLLALGGAMVLSSVFVIGAAFLLSLPLTTRLVELPVPASYVEFGIALVGIVAVVVVGLTATVVRQLPAILRVGGDTIPQRIARARRTSSLFHRMERVLGLIAVATGGGLAATAVAMAPSRPVRPGEVSAPTLGLAWFDELAQSVAIGTLAATAIVAILLIAFNAFTTRERPIGLLWDLLCFLPRAGHPFAPPCYTERVVPEVNERLRDWLLPSDGTSARAARSRRVILSAHSLGAVLAVSSILALHGTRSAPLARVGLLSYGTQLRPYFGRLFPELLGPAVLGTLPGRSPSLFADDAWKTQRLSDAVSRLPGSGAVSMRELLMNDRSDPAWQNLSRETDFLGFPSYSYLANDVDLLASETADGEHGPEVATHSGYPHTPEYDLAFAELLRRLS